MQAVGLQTHIWANNTRSIVLLAMFPVLLVLVLYGLQLVLMGFGVIPGSGGTLGDDMALAVVYHGRVTKCCLLGCPPVDPDSSPPDAVVVFERDIVR